MAITYGFFSPGSGDLDTGVLSRLESEIDAPGKDETVLNETDCVLRRRAVESGFTTTIIGTTLDAVRVAIVGRPLVPARAGFEISHLRWSQLTALLGELDGYWIAVGYDKSTNTLEVICDSLGVEWLYWAHVPGGVAFSSDFGALARCLPAAPRLDDDACLLSLILTYPVGDSTCFKEIRIVSPGSILQFRQRHVSERRLRLPSYGGRWVGTSREEKFGALDEALDASYRAWSLSSISVPWSVALSSGNDSRYGLGLLLRHGMRPACATFGLPGSTDIKGAIAICSRERLRHELFSTRLQTSWEAWGDAVQRLGVVGGFQYVAGWGQTWRHALAALGGQVVLGYLGDALSGRHLVADRGHDWLANWEAWSLDERDDGSWTGSEMLRPEARQRSRTLVRAALLQACEGIHFSGDYQRALHLDLFSRQRRATAAQVNFLTDEVPIAPLFYTRQMINFWSNLGYEDLKGQALYLEYARARYPRLFGPPRRPSLARRARGTLANLLVGFSPSLKPYLTPPEINTHALVGQHLNHARRLLDNCGETVSHLMDVDALRRWLDRFSTRESINAAGLTRFWNLLLLVEAGMSRRDR